MPENRIELEKKEYYARLLINRGRQVFLALICFGAFIGFAVYLFTNIVLGVHWLAFCGPILAVGLLLSSFPQTEEWEYKAWQNQSVKREQTFFN